MESFTPEELAMIERTSEALRQYPHLRRAFIRALQMEELFAIPEQLESLKQVVLELAAQYKQQQEQLNRIEQTANRALEVAERALQVAERSQQTAERANEIAERAQQTAERANEIAERALQVAERSQQTAERANEIAERALQVAERSQQTAERANEIAERALQVAERSQQTSERAQQTSEHAQQTAEHALQVALETRDIVNDMQKRLTRVEADVADLKGMSMELMARKLLPGVLGKLVRKLRVYEPDEFYRVMEEVDLLSADDLAEVASADAFAHGQLRSNDTPRWFVVEASWGLGMTDVERAAQRAAILTQNGAPAIGTVLGRRITADARKRAQQLGVLVVLNGAPRNPEVTT
jgi:DNA polymerase III gamma/tau subunit